MKKSLIIGLIAGVFPLCVSAVSAREAATVPAIQLPAGVTVASATPEQLAAAVVAAVKANPKQASTIIASVIGQLKGGDQAKVAAIFSGVAPMVPTGSLPGIVHAAAKANPELAPSIAGAASTAAPSLAVVIAKAASAGAPGSDAAIATEVAKAAPSADSAAIKTAASEGSALGAKGASLPSIIGNNPGGNSVNPANVTGSVVSPS